MKSSRIRIITFGCKVNQCDGDEMARALAAAGYEIIPRGEADAYIVNTCTVTATADAKARKLIRRLARDYPGAPVVVTGCWAQCDARAAALPEAALVVPNTGKAEIVAAMARLLPSGAGTRPHTQPARTRTRAFLTIQDGCDHHCAYCAVPAARGLPESRPRADALGELRRIADDGIQEAVLCGIRLGAYGVDQGREFSLAGLLREMREIPIPRIRLSSIETMDITGELLEEMRDHPTLCHHLHLPLQAGDDAVLAAMGRGYTTEGFRSLVAQVREVWPDVGITTDVMVGFPGESDEHFAHTVQFVREIGFSRLHVFPYSPRPGTPAAERTDQVAASRKRDRSEQLIAVGAELAHQAALNWVGREVSVLFEEEKGGRLTGLSEHYLRVWCEGPREWVGRTMTVTPSEASGGELVSVAERLHRSARQDSSRQATK